jgi:hypothetical protein
MKTAAFLTIFVFIALGASGADNSSILIRNVNIHPITASQRLRPGR